MSALGIATRHSYFQYIVKNHIDSVLFTHIYDKRCWLLLLFLYYFFAVYYNDVAVVFAYALSVTALSCLSYTANVVCLAFQRK